MRQWLKIGIGIGLLAVVVGIALLLLQRDEPQVQARLLALADGPAENPTQGYLRAQGPKDFEVPADVPLRLSFDVNTQSRPGEANKTLVSAARFINMHARAGVADERVQLAVVVHGKAVFDVSRDPEKRADATANERLVAALPGPVCRNRTPSGQDR